MHVGILFSGQDPSEHVTLHDSDDAEHDLKWKDCAEMSLFPVEDQTLSKRLQLASIGIFQQLSGTGYARLDFRLNLLSVLFFLETNPNCSIFMPTPESYGSADTILINDRSLPAFVHHILERARTRSIG
ncbi:hypothetical protein [Robbsia sp. KACC 23696]|uniref:hypothetical protein n=1 Tax=Robbsia sp. KACC 23696 TaxID=3149231 RepID=UPI00325BA2BA